MKVLHVIDSLGLGGGAEHALVQQLPGLRDAGIEGEVAVLTHRGFGLEKRIEELGFPLHVLDGPSLLKRVRALRRLVKETRPDLVHATLWDSCLTSRLALLGTRTPLINSIVNLTYDPVRREFEGRTRWRDEAIRMIDSVTIRRVDRVHALTEAVASDTVSALRVKRSKITVIPRGREGRSPEEVAEARARVRAEMGLADEVPVIITVGRQDHQKDQVTLVRAFALVLEEHPEARLWLVGRPGTQTSEIEAAIDEAELADSVDLFGHRDDAVEFLCAADVFVFPSVYEGLGSAVVEAMAVGLTIIVSDSPALSEVIGDAGVVEPMGDWSRFAIAVNSAITAEPKRATKARSVNRWQEFYSKEVIIRQHVGIYHRQASL